MAYNIATFEPNEEGIENSIFHQGTMEMTLNGQTKRIQVAINRHPRNFNGAQPFIQTTTGFNELEAVLEDGSVVRAEYFEYLGAAPRFNDRYNMHNRKQKKVVEYRFNK